MNLKGSENISMIQLFVLIVLFQIGSSVVVGIGGEAGRDVWIAILLATVIGIALIWVYVKILSIDRGQNLFQIMESVLGRIPAIVLGYLYSLYFLYIASRVLRDFLDMLSSDTFYNTPMEVLGVAFMLCVIYVVYLGPEVLCRTAEILFPYVLGSLFLIALFFLIGDNVAIKLTRPVLAEGFKPIFDSLFPKLVTFPFGEVIVISLLMTYTTYTKTLGRVSMAAVAFSGVFLASYKFLTMAVLGESAYQTSQYPLVTAVRLVTIAEFIERIDPFIVFVMMLGIFIKVSVFFYGGLKGVEYLTNIPYRYYVLPIGFVICLTSVLISSNIAEHIKIGLEIVPAFMHIPMQIIIPFFLLTIYFVKKSKRNKKKAEGLHV